MKINSFHPPDRILMGPGPSNVHPRVLEAMSRPTVGHLDPAFIGMMDKFKVLLRDTFLTKNEVTFSVSGPGSLGMETAVVNLVEPGMKVIVCVNGAFDVVYSGSQKCLSCPPGLSPITFNERAVKAVKNRKTKVQSWFMDIGLILSYWSGARRTYHHTAPINALYGLHEALCGIIF